MHAQKCPFFKMEEEKYMEKTPIQTMFNKFAAEKDIELIYGEPIKH